MSDLVADFGVLDGVCLLLYANKLDLDQDSPLDVNEVRLSQSLRSRNRWRMLAATRVATITSPLFGCRRLSVGPQIADHLEFNNPNNKILQERLWHIQVRQPQLLRPPAESVCACSLAHTADVCCCAPRRAAQRKRAMV